MKHKYVCKSQNLDAISSLPDDVLVYLLSFVDMKTAAKTSILSKRLRYLWTHQTDLDFEDPSFFLIHNRTIWNQKDMHDKYCKWIKQVVAANRAPFLNTLKIHFRFDEFHAADIDKWVEISLSKDIRNLELNLSNWMGYAMPKAYKLRCDRVFKHSTHQHLCLKSLHLEALSVEGTVLENISSNFPNLERLTVKICTFYFPETAAGAGLLRATHNLFISSPNMKHFEFSNCLNIKSVQISGPKLTSLVLAGWKLEVVYTNVPALVSVTFGYAYCFDIFSDLRLFTNFSSQLQQLSLNWHPGSLDLSLPTKFPPFPNVKQLDIMVSTSVTADDDHNLLALISFIEACPVLHTFKLKLQPSSTTQSGALISAQDDAQNNAIRPHKHLKAVEFIGFYGSAFVAKLALSLSKNSRMLTKIIFDPRCPQSTGSIHNIVDIEIVDQIGLWRSHAKVFAKKIRVGVDVVIL